MKVYPEPPTGARAMPATTYATHPETKPANTTDANGQTVEVIGTTVRRVTRDESHRVAVTLTYWTANGTPMVTVDTPHNQKDYNGKCRQAAVRFAKKVLADESNDARFYE